MSNKSIIECAKEYQPKSAKNISELKSISTNLLVQTELGIDDEGKEYSYNYIEVEGERYRLPDSVLANVKTILEKKPDLKEFTVSKSGEGRQTRYTVIPIV